MSDANLSKQVADQCRVVAHLAKVISEVHAKNAKIFDDNALPTITGYVGEETAAIMEQLGEILNRMDVVAPEDAWTDPIFERAQKLFPTKVEV